MTMLYLVLNDLQIVTYRKNTFVNRTSNIKEYKRRLYYAKRFWGTDLDVSHAGSDRG